LIAVAEPFAAREGIDLQARMDEAAAQRENQLQQLVERLHQSVLPLFKADERGRPDMIGSCVLVELDSNYYAFTAAHVMQDAGSADLGIAAGGEVVPLPWTASSMTLGGDDVGVFLLHASVLDVLEQTVFLGGHAIDEQGMPDDTAFTSSYIVLGYPASRRQTKISHPTRQVRLRSFHCTTSPVDLVVYLQENLSRSDHVVLEFDHQDIVIKRQRVNPPKLQGVSGGGVFHLSKDTSQSTLIAIATENRRNSGLIVGTRLKHFLADARALKTQVANQLARSLHGKRGFPGATTTEL
jgi:hypothetical protein